jgi:hypothetical protein
MGALIFGDLTMPRKSKEERAKYNREYRSKVIAEGGDRYQKMRESSEKWKRDIDAAGGEAAERLRGLRARWQRNWRDNNPKQRLIIDSRSRAHKSGSLHTITVETVTWPTHCPVLGIELDYRTLSGGRAKRNNSPSLDRWDNNQGYVVGNVFVISHRANRLKSDASVDELERIAKYARHGLTKC